MESNDHPEAANLSGKIAFEKKEKWKKGKWRFC